ncbi:MAG: Sec-independent protein translocase protein TatB [Rhodospirillales bacterium]
MFDIGWQEIFLIAVVALIVIGPKDLPRALKTVTGALRKVKGMARDFQNGLDDIVRESELDDMRKQIEAETGGDIRKSIENSIDPDGSFARDVDDMRSVESDLTNATRGFSDDVNKTKEPAKSDLPDAGDAFSAPPEPDKPEAKPEQKATVPAGDAASRKSGEG